MSTDITITRKAIKEATTGFSKIRQGQACPIPILFESQGGQLVATATNLDAWATYTFEGVSASDPMAFFAIDLPDLCSISKGKSSDVLAFSAEGNTLSVTCNGATLTYSLSVRDQEWPTRPAMPPIHEATGFCSAFRAVAMAASTDATRYILNGVYMDIDHDAMVGTDGRRLTRLDSDDEGRMARLFSASCIVPTAPFLAWAKLSDDAAVGGNDTHFGLVTGPWSYVSRLVDGAYPNYRQVLPGEGGSFAVTLSDQDCSIITNTLAAVDKKGSVMIWADEQRCAWAIIRDQQGVERTAAIALSATYVRAESAESKVRLEGRFLNDCFACGFRSLAYVDNLSPLLFTADNGIHVLMPMRG